MAPTWKYGLKDKSKASCADLQVNDVFLWTNGILFCPFFVIGWDFIDAFRCTILSFTHSWIKSTNINSLQSPKTTALPATTHKRNNLFCNNTTHSPRNHLLTGKEMNKNTIQSLLSPHVIVFNLASLSFLCYEPFFFFTWTTKSLFICVTMSEYLKKD